MSTFGATPVTELRGQSVRPARLWRSTVRAVPYRFRGELWRHQGEAAWYFVTLPVEIADEIDERTMATRRGFGSVRVSVTIGSTSWATSVFPDSSSRSFVLPVKKQVRAAEGLDDGDVVDVVLELADTAAGSS